MTTGLLTYPSTSRPVMPLTGRPVEVGSPGRQRVPELGEEGRLRILLARHRGPGITVVEQAFGVGIAGNAT